MGLTEEEFNKLTKEQQVEYLTRLKAIKGKEDLIYLCREILGYDRILESVHKKLEDRLLGPSRRKLILLPRGSFKSTIATIGMTIFDFLRDPNIRVLIDSEVLENSCKFLEQIKVHLRQDKFRLIYGDLISKNHRETSREFTVSTRTNHNLKESTVYATGIGTVNVGQHYDKIVCDDLHSEKNTSTKEQIDKVISHYRLLLSLLEPNGQLTIIGTRWHFYDLYSWLLEEEIAEEKSSKNKIWNVYIEQAKRDDGSLFFPERLNETFLLEQRRAQGAYLYSCQYQNNPVSEETQVFKKEYFRYWGEAGDIYPGKDGSRTLLNIYILIDRAFSSSKTADYTGCVCVGVSTTGSLYVLEAERHKFGLNELEDLIFAWTRKYGEDRVRYVGFESINYEEIESHFKQAMNNRKKYLNIVRLKPDNRQRKEDRIETALQALYSNHKVYHKKRMMDLEDELLRFPVGTHDDLIDALAYIKQVMVVPGNPLLEGRQFDYRPSGFFGKTGY